MKSRLIAKKVAAIMQAAIMTLSSIVVAEVSQQNVIAKETVSGIEGVGETLSDRAVVAFEASNNTTVIGTDGTEYTEGVYLSWRSFEEDDDNTTFTVYRNNVEIISGLKYTNLLDEGGNAGDTYTVVGSNDNVLGIKQASTTAWSDQYVEFQFYVPSNQTMPDGSIATYSANDMSVGDLDGNGDYELIVKWYPSNAKDNSEEGYTGTTFIDAYDIDMNTGGSKLLWRIDMGLNIRSGAHYTQFQVWDFSGDGKADIAVKTADGTTIYVSEDGTDQSLTETGHVGAVSAKDLDTCVLSGSENYDYRDSIIASSGKKGYVLDGVEYFTIIDGSSGDIFDTVDYEPGRGTVANWGDSYGNRVDRFTSCVAYLDGENETAYAVFNRGYYTRMASTAYYLDDNNKIQIKWKFDTDTYDFGNSEWTREESEGQGNHAVSVNDVDGDGKDEIILGSLTLDDDGLIYYTTGYGHGDALHASDWVSWNDGLEIMQVHEESESEYAAEIRDANTGEVLMGYAFVKDTARGVAGDIDPTSGGAEWWASYGVDGTKATASVYATTSTIGKLVKLADSTPSINFTILWDGDLLTELQDHVYSDGSCQAVTVTKWDYENEKEIYLLYEEEASTSNTTKGNVGLVADIAGDWREEIVTRTSNANKVRIYTTNYMTDYVVPTLVQNHAYRLGVAWQNVGYNQPANTEYLISEGVITAQLSIDTVTSDYVQLSFTEANDGNRYGYNIEGYEVYRSGDGGATYELVSSTAEVVKTVVGKYGFSKTAGSEEDVTYVTGAADNSKYSLSSTGTIGSGSNGKMTITDNNGTGLASSLTSNIYGVNDLTFTVKGLDEGTYRVDVYSAAEGNSSATNVTDNNYIYINGEEKGEAIYANGGTYDVSDLCFSSEVVVDADDGTITVKAENTIASKRAYINYVVITRMDTVEGDTWNPDELVFVDNDVEPETTYLYRIAAVVNGRTSYLSKTVEVSTGFAISGVKDNYEVELTQSTPIPDGGTVLDLLPNTFTVTGEDGEERGSTVLRWVDSDSTPINIDECGIYEGVTAHLVGWVDPVSVIVKVIAAQPESYEDIVIYRTLGEELELLEKVTVTMTNSLEEYLAVIWDTEKISTSTIGEYTVTGSLEDYPEFEVELTLNVVEDYIEEVLSEDSYIEVVIGTAWEDVDLPETVAVLYHVAGEGTAAVEWDSTGYDSEEENIIEITGTAQASNGGAVTAYLYVDYAPVYKFDFGISDSNVADGWIGVMFAERNSTKTHGEFDYMYGQHEVNGEKLNYGVLDSNGNALDSSATATQGRTETYEKNGILPYEVYTDFALLKEQFFVVDVANGTYQVEAIVTSNSNVNSAVFTLEDGQASMTVSNGSVENYGIGQATVEVTDGQLSIYASNTTNRIGGFIIRLVEAAEAGEIAIYEELTVEVAANSTAEAATEKLPTTLQVFYADGTSEYAAVTWDSLEGVDLSTTGTEYKISGTLTDEKYNEYKVELTLKIVSDYITEITTKDIYYAAEIGESLAYSIFPTEVSVKYVSGNTGTAAVTWDYSAWDTGAVTYSSSNEDEPIAIKGTVAGCEDVITLYLSVDYEAVWLFDFGTTTSAVEYGWTGVQVNVQNGTTSNSELGIYYDVDTGYGFDDDGLSTLDGRNEIGKFTVVGTWPENVYGDYAVVKTAFEFMADVENGEYVVEIMVSGTSQSTTYYSVEGGSAFSLRNDTYNYKVQRVTGVTVADGKISITGQTGTHRLAMIVIRKVSSAGEDTTVNKTALQSLYNSVSGYSSREYTNSSWTVFSTALKEAEEMLASTTAAQGDVDTMITKLQAANDALVKRAEVTSLNKLISEAETIESTKYTSESYNALKDKIGEAEAIVNNVESGGAATQDDVNYAYAALQTAINSLVEKGGDEEDEEEKEETVDSSALEWLISVVNDVNLSDSDYTEESLSYLSCSIASAVDVCNSEAVSQSEIDNALNDLLYAISCIEAVEDSGEGEEETVDLSDLFSLMQSASDIIANFSGYTADTWSAFKEAYSAAFKALTESEDQGEVNAAYSSLSDVISNMVEKEPEIEAVSVTGGITANNDKTTVYTRLEDSSVDISYTFAVSQLTNAKQIQVEVNYSGNGVMSYSGINVAQNVSYVVDDSGSGVLVITLTADDGSLINGNNIELFTLNFTVDGGNLPVGTVVQATASVSSFMVIYYHNGDTSFDTEAKTSEDPDSAGTSITFYYSKYDTVLTGKIDEEDINYVISQLGKTDNNSCDFNGDGIVDIRDLTMILAAYNYDEKN